MKWTFMLREFRENMALPFYPRSCGRNLFESGGEEDLKPADFIEICWVETGRCRFWINDAFVTADAGDCVFRLPGEPRRKQAPHGMRTVVHWATFEGRGAVDFLNGFGYPREVLRPGGCPVLLFERIARGLASPLSGDYRQLVAVYAELLAAMGGRPVPQPGAAEKLARECLYILNREYNDPEFNVNLMAERLGVHRTTINRAVRRAAGIPPVRYLERCRIEHALELLNDTVLPVSEVARRTGFRRVNYFCRAVRNAVGRSPLEYRNRREPVRKSCPDS